MLTWLENILRAVNDFNSSIWVDHNYITSLEPFILIECFSSLIWSLVVTTCY